MPINVAACEELGTNEKAEEAFVDNCCYLDNNKASVNLDTEIRHFIPNQNITITFSVSSNIRINQYDYSHEGLNIVSINIAENENSRINVEIMPMTNSLEGKLIIELFLNNGETLFASLYAISNEYGTFISQFSYDDAREYFFSFAINNSILNEDECATIRNNILNESCIQSISVRKSSQSTENINTMSTNSVSSTSYKVEGSLIWQGDNNKYHQLRGIKVELRYKTLVGSNLIETVCTNNIGRFSFVVDHSDNKDIFIRVFPGDDNIVIKHGVLNAEYYWDSDIIENISFGDDVSISNIFKMTSDCGRALQISQALLTARNYVIAMSGLTPSNVKVKYPQGDNCSYSSTLNTIYITGNERYSDSYPHSYASWDTIMHEYGHHIQDEMKIANNPGGNHQSNKNDADILNNKDKGIRLAWGESWPTVFALMVQQFYSSQLTNIDTVGNSSYESYNGNAYNIETTAVRLGEACERSIMGVLWDIYDGENESGDNLALGHQAYWNVTTEGQSKTFSSFITYFYQKYPYYIESIGSSLSYYKMATSKPIITNASNLSQTTPPTFSWVAQGGSTTYPNNCFVLIVYDTANQEILRSSMMVTTTYTFTQEEWNTILNSYGTTFRVAVSASSLYTPITGPYVSEKSNTISKPTIS